MRVLPKKRVLVAMSGGVDSSVAAGLALEAGYEVVGATMKLWGGDSDSGCCSVADVDDARRVAQQLGIVHHVFNFTAEFNEHVVDRYVDDHASGRTPNPCIECNRHLKFDRLLRRAAQLGFDAVATGHHARIEPAAGGGWSLLRGADPAKDQSYVLHMLTQAELARVILPIGAMTKAEVRAKAAALGLRTATKADSQDVCFISKKGGRQAFLGTRIPLRPARVYDTDGVAVGSLAAVELVTVGQRRNLGPVGRVDPSAGDDGRRYVVAVDPVEAAVTVGPLSALMTTEIPVGQPTWVDSPPEAGEAVLVQMSAHGRPMAATWSGDGVVRTDEPVRRVAPGQSVVVYRRDTVVGGALAV